LILKIPKLKEKFVFLISLKVHFDEINKIVFFLSILGFSESNFLTFSKKNVRFSRMLFS